MNFLIYIFIAIIMIVGLVWTYIIFKQEEKKIKQYELEDVAGGEELKRSLEYEKTSVTSNVRNLAIVYIIVITLSLIVFAIYIF